MKASLQCRRILGGRNLVRVRNIVVVAIFDFMTVHGRLGRAEIVTLTVGARAKEGKGGGGGEKENACTAGYVKTKLVILAKNSSVKGGTLNIFRGPICCQIFRRNKA